MSQTYFTILTNLGAAKLAEATASGTQLKLTHLAVGDGNGNVPSPLPTQTQLIHEVRRSAINTVYTDENNENHIIIEQVIPPEEGGFYIRELGVFDEKGNLIAVGNCPPSYKPKLSEGSGRTQVINMVIMVDNTGTVELKIDASTVLATRKYVDDLISSKMTEHEKSTNHPDASTTKKGFVQLNSAINSTLENQAATPKAVKTAYDLANTANTTANTAKTNAATAQTKADSAYTLANTANTTANTAKSTAETDASATVKGRVQLNSAVNSTVENQAATPKAVKTSYDLANTANMTANTAKTNAATAQTKADSAYTLANTAKSTAETDASTTVKGRVQLNSAVNSTVENQAATPKAVKTAYDLANTANTTANTANTTANTAKSTAETDASTTVKGRVQLNSAVNSTVENQAATPKAVKTAYDLANTANQLKNIEYDYLDGTATNPITMTFQDTKEFNDKYTGKSVLYVVEIQVTGNDGIIRWLEYPFNMFIAGSTWTSIGFKCTRNPSENKILVASGSYSNIFNPNNDYRIWGWKKGWLPLQNIVSVPIRLAIYK